MKKYFTYSFKSLSLIWSYNKLYLLLTLVSILLGAIQVFPGMYLINYSIDFITKRVGFREYLVMLASIIGIMLAVSLLSMLVNNRLSYERERLYSKLKLQIDKVCLRSDYMDIQTKSYLEKKDFALKAIDNDSLNLFINSMRSIISSLLVASGVLYIISAVSFWILIPVAVSLAIDLFNDYLNARQNFVDTKESIDYNRKSSYLRSISSDFAYAKEIRMFNLKERFKARMDEVDELLFKLREIRRKKLKPSGILAYSSESILDISVYLYFGWKVITSAISLGNFSLYINAMHQLKNSISDIIYVAVDYLVNIEYLRGLFDFIGLKNDSDGLVSSEPNNVGAHESEICFENVSFRYSESEQYALKNVNIKIKSGEKLLVVGKNGAGKSTFVKLLCGLFKPTSGRILLDGVDISTIPHSEYMKKISAVFQDYRLLSLSIADNISSMSVNDWQSDDYEKVDNTITTVGLADKIGSFPQKCKTQLYRIFDKDGVELSGGEMQKLAIARAMYKNAPIIVLDEPTSALDPKSEYEIFSSFKKISANRTAVYVSHRLSSIKFTDRIAVFDGGKVVEYGTHEELMAKKGLYSELYSMQAELYVNDTEPTIEIKEVSQAI